MHCWVSDHAFTLFLILLLQTLKRWPDERVEAEEQSQKDT